MLPYKNDALRSQTAHIEETRASLGFPKGFPFGERGYLRGGIEPPLRRFFKVAEGNLLFVFCPYRNEQTNANIH